MALINCPRCGGKISERAQQCPHCGCTKQEMEQIAEEQRLQAEHEAEEARIQAKKEAEELAAQRREWWKNNKKKVYVVLAIIIGLAAGVQAFKVIAEHKSITLAKQYIASGDSCVSIYRFDEAQEFYQKAKECTQDPDIQRIVDDQKRAHIHTARTKADEEYNKALRRLKILLDADEYVFNAYSNQALNKMIEIYPNRQETMYYNNNLRKENQISDNIALLADCSFAQKNYEKEGDVLFLQKNYEQAIKKYKAALEILGEDPAIRQKILDCELSLARQQYLDLDMSGIIGTSQGTLKFSEWENTGIYTYSLSNGTVKRNIVLEKHEGDKLLLKSFDKYGKYIGVFDGKITQEGNQILYTGIFTNYKGSSVKFKLKQ